MGIRTKRMNSQKDKERLLKRFTKLTEESWIELNEISGLDPKYHNRLFVYEQLKVIQQCLS